MVNMALHLKHDAQLTNLTREIKLKAGTVVEYMYHIPGGFISVGYKGMVYTMNPNDTKELEND